MYTPAKCIRVLIADDEKNIADSLALIVESHGFLAVPVYTGESAVERARTLKPDVLISDIFMPGKSGIQAATEICDARPACRVLLMTGQTALDDLKTIQAPGHEFPVLQKPFRPELLLRFLSGTPAAYAHPDLVSCPSAEKTPSAPA